MHYTLVINVYLILFHIYLFEILFFLSLDACASH